MATVWDYRTLPFVQSLTEVVPQSYMNQVQVHVHISIVLIFLKEVVTFRLKTSLRLLKFIFSWRFREKQDASYTVHLFDISMITVSTEEFATK